MPATYEKIATTTLGSAQANITLGSIPSTYTDLVFIFTTITSVDSSELHLRFNGDTATNYSVTTLYGDGASAASGAGVNNNKITFGYPSSSTVPVMGKINVFSYAGSTFKTCLAEGAFDENGAGRVMDAVGLWRSTSAITSITLLPGSGNLNTGSTATLYGILRA